MNTFITTTELAKGFATTLQATIYTAHPERPSILTSLHIHNDDSVDRTCKAWVNGQPIASVVLAAGESAELIPKAMGLPPNAIVELMADTDPVIFYILSGQ